MTTTTTQTNPVQGTTLHGRVHGGQNPISGAHVYLYAINNTGYGSASLSLLTSGAGQDSLGYYVTTDSNGMFTITGDYTCPTAYAQTYVYAVGGDPGLGSGANSAATLLAGVDACNASSFVIVNEVSTVASVYAVAGYAVDPTHASRSGSTLAQTGLGNAGDTVSNLYTQSTGVALATTPAGNGTVPQAEINTLANILAACVNSTGPTSTQCTTLFNNAKNGSTAPTDTATAALNIAHNPGANVANLFGLQTPGAPFQPLLTTAPNDFTIAITYTGGGLELPDAIAIDKSGNVWTGNVGNASISEFSPFGSPLSGSSGYTGAGMIDPIFIAVDNSGNVWAPNGPEGNSLSEFGPTGSPVSEYTSDVLNAPWAFAFDASGNVWVANVGGAQGSISEYLTSTSSWSSNSPFTTGGVDVPISIAVDVLGNVWVANDGGGVNGKGSISEFSSSGTAYAGSPYSGGGLFYPGGIAIDVSGNVWVANGGNNSLTEYDPTTNEYPSGSNGYTGGGLSMPENIAIDGAGNLWMPNYECNCISEFNSSGVAVSNSNGYQELIGSLSGSYALAIDGAGNVWVANANANSITEFIGVATPVVTPVVANLLSPYGSHAVNKP